MSLRGTGRMEVEHEREGWRRTQPPPPNKLIVDSAFCVSQFEHILRRLMNCVAAHGRNRSWEHGGNHRQISCELLFINRKRWRITILMRFTISFQLQHASGIQNAREFIIIILVIIWLIRRLRCAAKTYVTKSLSRSPFTHRR